MRKVLFLINFFYCVITSQAQLLPWTPNFPTENDPSGNVVIIMDATKGNQGLLNYTPTTDVYVHTGVITNFSTSETDWKHVKFNQVFTQPNAALQATYIGNNKWQFTIPGSLRTYYGVTDAGETIKKIAILFRNGNGSRVQRNSNGSDMYIPVYTASSLSVRFTNPPLEPRYVPVPEAIIRNVGDNIAITAIANKFSNMALYLNGVSVQSASNVNTISANPTITTAGLQEIIARADSGGVVTADTIRFFVANPVTILPLPPGVKAGINYEADSTAATLVVHAPLKNRISLIGEFPGSNWTEQSQYQLNKTPDGNYWWIRITGLTPRTEYAFQYLVDGNLKIADPYAEKILDPFNNNDQNIPAATYPGLKPYPNGLTTGIVSILQTAPPSYSWSVTNFQRPDKRNLIIYELLVRDFVAAHDWKTLRDSLNYLKNLGVNAIEIMPFNEFEGNNSWGYNPDFYFAPDKYYGPKNTLKEFIDSCHKKGIAVIMDIALNHSFGLSPMVQLYSNSNGWPTAANPWFNPDQDTLTAGYQDPHPFGVGYDMNHESLATRSFVSRVVEHWLLEYKIDGFRFDLSKGFTQVYSGTNVGLWGNYDASRVAIWKRYFDTVQTKSPGAYVILEHFADNPEEIELSNYGMLFWGNMNYNYSQAAMGYSTDWNFEGGIFTVRGWTQPHLITYMESHDEERIMYRNINFGNSSGSYNIKDTNTALRRAELDAAFFLTIPGPKMIWQFGELGYDYSINYCVNGTINNNCRLDPKPIRWDYLQQVRRKRLYDIYSSLLKLRVHPQYKDAFTSNRIERSLGGAVKWIKVTTDTSNLLVVGNFDVVQQTAAITFQSAGTWYDYLEGSTISTTGGAQNITLQPGEYHVYLNRNITNAVTTPVSNLPNPQNGLYARIYPNPVYKNAIIEITIPESGFVEVELLSSTGQRIMNIHNGFLIKGDHKLFFTGKSKKPSPGSYNIRLIAGNKTRIIKVVLQ